MYHRGCVIMLNSGISGTGFGLRSLNSAYGRLGKATEKLSTGLRINRAADDAAGLSIATKLESRIRGNSAARRNIGDGISSARTAGGGLSAIRNDLQRMRELAVQASNGTNSPEQSAALNAEATALQGNIDDVAANTEFNGVNLLDGSAGTQSIVTSDDGSTTDIDYSQDNSSATLTPTVDLSNPAAASASIAEIDAALETVTAQEAELGASENALASMEEAAFQREYAAASAQSRVQDTDVASGMSDFMAASVQAKLAGSMLGVQNNVNSSLINSLFG